MKACELGSCYRDRWDMGGIGNLSGWNTDETFLRVGKSATG